VQSAVARLNRPSTVLLARHGDALVLVLLGLPTAVIDWQIAATWSLPVWISLLAIAVVGVAFGLVLMGGRLAEAGSAAAVAVLYALPVIGGIARWYLVPSPMTLIGDGALQMQISRTVLIRGIDPYGFNYDGTGLEHAPWGQPFPNPALHHLDYWPGTVLIPLPIQAAFQSLFGWWDERIWLLIAAIAVWLLIRRLVGGVPGRMAALALFLIPGHSLLAVLGDNDLPMLGLLLAGALAIVNRKWLLAGLVLGLAIATKQTALIAVPVLVAWAIYQGADRGAVLRATGVGAATTALFFAPFLLWNAAAFINDTLVFNFGGGSETYPIQGIGLSAWLLQMGIISGPRDAFPFALIQLPLVVTAWILAGRWLTRHRRAGDALLWMGIAFFVFLFTNRFSQPAYLLLAIELMLAGLLARLDNLGNVPLALVRPHRLGGRIPPGSRGLGGDGLPPAIGEDGRRGSVAD
jgi:glycosyl transferase family 87